MKTQKWLLTLAPISLVSVFFLFNSIGDVTKDQSELIHPDTSIAEKPRSIPISELEDSTILAFSKVNSCYLPLIQEASYFSKKFGKRLLLNDLFNSNLPENHPYRNRYIVGDFNVLEEDLTVRGIEEINPILSMLVDFKGLDSSFFRLLENAQKSEEDETSFIQYVNNHLAHRKDELLNFYTKVWKYQTPGIKRLYGIIGETAYASGQRLCLCEVQGDTLIEVARFATSSKRLDPVKYTGEDGKEHIRHIQYLPTEHRRDYYGLHYRITSKNWETQRKYESYDAKHDSCVGGGNTRITRYKGRIELPNFLLMNPDESNPRAMRQNGIHEVALRELTRGMLGSSNSIGCIRVTDFGSKFLRWWTPQDANFFILYEDNRYFASFPKAEIKAELPFKNQKEGDSFRKWLIDFKPFQAEQLNIDPTGKFDNGYILDAYNLYGKEYDEWLVNQRTNGSQ